MRLVAFHFIEIKCHETHLQITCHIGNLLLHPYSGAETSSKDPNKGSCDGHNLIHVRDNLLKAKLHG